MKEAQPSLPFVVILYETLFVIHNKGLKSFIAMNAFTTFTLDRMNTRNCFDDLNIEGF